MLQQQSQQPQGRGLTALYRQACPQNPIPRTKEANISYRTPEAQAAAKRSAFTQLMRLMGLGLAAGGGTRALIGARNLVRDTQIPSPGIIEEPVPLLTIEEKKRREKRSVDTPKKSPWWNRLAQMLPNITTASPLGDWWGPTAGIAAGAGGLYGGWKLTDWLLDREREMLNEREVDEAQADYQKALAEQYRAAMQAKNAEDTLGIDDVFDVFDADTELQSALRDKEAGIGGVLDWLYSPFGHDNVQGAKGALLAAMALLATGAGAATYNYTKGQNSQEILNKAMKLRAQRRAAASPPPIYTVPQSHPSLPTNDEADDIQYAA